MQRLRSCLLLFFLVLLVVFLGLLIRSKYRSNGHSAPPLPSSAPPPTALEDVPSPPPPPGREPRPPEPHLVTAAKQIMGNPSEGSCGPYRLVSDVTDAQYLAICERVASPLEGMFRRRLGLEPRGRPLEGIFLFQTRSDFQDFAKRDGRLRSGYAGYANGAKGYLAIPAGSLEPGIFATTLAHELTHLLLRRAMGPGLPPWLSEGLADAMGDPATPAGLGELTGLVGVEGQARRLRDAYRSGVAGGLEELVARRRKDFDQGTLSFDYEQSALLVRFLLLQPGLGERFRSYLQGVAGASVFRPDQLTEGLGRSWNQLDSEFKAWVLASL